jgi:hypothetical protein
MVKPRLSLGENFVSIPDRVLGFFRLERLKFHKQLVHLHVSIPDRVLGFFRQEIEIISL